MKTGDLHCLNLQAREAARKKEEDEDEEEEIADANSEDSDDLGTSVNRDDPKVSDRSWQTL